MILWAVTWWFPQSYASEFFAIKGALALVSTLMVVIHMHQTWGTVTTFGRQLRYMCLLATTILLVGESVEQNELNILVAYRHWGELVVILLLMVAMAVSLREDAHNPGPR